MHIMCGEYTLDVPDSTGERALAAFARGDFEQDTIELVSALARADDTVLEGGAGVGVVTVAAAQCAAHVLTIEANPDLVPLVARNVERNAPGRDVRVLNGVLCVDNQPAYTQRYELFALSDPWWNSSLASLPEPAYCRRRRRIPVLAFSVTALLQENEVTTLILDVEGAEYDLLAYLEAPACLRTIIVEWHLFVAVDPMREARALATMYRQGFHITAHRVSADAHAHNYVQALVR